MGTPLDRKVVVSTVMDENEIHDVEEDLVAEETSAPASPREPIPWGLVLLLIWAVLLTIFSVQNAQQVTVEFLGWDWQMPLALLMMVTALVTLVITGVGMGFYRRRRRKRRQMKDADRHQD